MRSSGCCAYAWTRPYWSRRPVACCSSPWSGSSGIWRRDQGSGRCDCRGEGFGLSAWRTLLINNSIDSWGQTRTDFHLMGRFLRGHARWIYSSISKNAQTERLFRPRRKPVFCPLIPERITTNSRWKWHSFNDPCRKNSR